MKSIHYALFIAIGSMVVSAVAQDLTPVDTNSILKELDKVDSGAKTQLTSRRNSAISQVGSASGSGSSALDFYLQALENTKYVSSHTEFEAWKLKNGDLLRNTSFASALQLQLQYLLLALQRSDKNDAFAQIPACQSYLSKLSALEANILLQRQNLDTSTHTTGKSKGAARRPTSPSENLTKALDESDRILNESLKNSDAVQYFKITDLIPGDKDFAGSPGQYDDILEKNIRGPLRLKNDPRLLATWDQQMAYGAAMVNASSSQEQADDFNQKTLPNLFFNKAKDTALIGQPNRALSLTLDLIHRCPTNPSIKDWIAFARGLLTKGSAVATTATPAQTNSPAPAPSTNAQAKP
jgi:hypothetical protein